MQLKEFGNFAVKLARNPLGIIALVFVMVYGIAGLVTSSKSLQITEHHPLIWFIVIFPFFMVIVFYKLVTSHHLKLYAPSDFSNEENFLVSIENKKKEISKIAEAVLMVANIIIDGSGRYGGMPKVHMDKIKEYQNSIKSYLPENMDGEIIKVICELNDEINNK